MAKNDGEFVTLSMILLVCCLADLLFVTRFGCYYWLVALLVVGLLPCWFVALLSCSCSLESVTLWFHGSQAVTFNDVRDFTCLHI
jgi:hypothetical protein